MEVGAASVSSRLDLILVSAAYEHIAATYFSNTLPHFGHCAGTAFSKLAGAALITVFLGLFVKFYAQTYRATSGSPRANGHTNARNSSSRANEKKNGIMFVIYCRCAQAECS